jgi:ankyrin repeat protein
VGAADESVAGTASGSGADVPVQVVAHVLRRDLEQLGEACLGHTEIARHLLERGARIDHPGYFDAPGLHWAASSGHPDTARFLLALDTAPDIRDCEFDADARAWALEGGSEEVEALFP